MSDHNAINGWQARNALCDAADIAHASLVCATVAEGRITGIDASAAFGIKGIVSILTHQNLGYMPEYQIEEGAARSRFRLLHDDEIVFKGQPVALVVADTPDIARLAASRVGVEYQRGASADVRRHCEIPIEHLSSMEGDAVTAIFEGPGRLSIRHTTYGVQTPHHDLGSRFGSELHSPIHVMLAARAALALQRSLQLVLTSQQMQNLTIGSRLFSEKGARGGVLNASVRPHSFVVPSDTSTARAA